MSPTAPTLLQDLSSWLIVFGGLSTIVVLVVLAATLIGRGFSGVSALLGSLLADWPRKIGAGVGCLAMAAGEAWAGWKVMPMVATFLADQFGKLPLPAMLMASGVVGGMIGLIAGALTGLVIGAAIVDALSASPRRVMAIASLVFKEAIRRKALLVFVVFAILCMFAGWFLTNSNSREELQVKVYVSFLLTVLTWLVMPVVLLLSCWGLPEDIKARSLHTVVTKPVRRNEVVLGRILGFAAIGTVVLAVMSTIGGVWIRRQVPDAAQASLTCRVPVFGSMAWRDRTGENVDRGINVGDVWDFRSYIEGGTRARAIWKFDSLTPDLMVDVPEGKDGALVPRLMLETRFQAFRVHKGNMNRSLLCQLALVSDAKKVVVPLKPFEVREFFSNVVFIDRNLSYFDDRSKEMKTYDLFDDLAPEGKLRIEARCIDPGQYLGMAQPDLFVRTPDRPFEWGFFKAVAGIWLMMLLIIVLSVTASCFVKGPVATVLTFSLVLIGSFFQSFLVQVATGAMKNSGTFESMYRIVEHKNPMVDLDKSTGVSVMQAVDKVPQAGLWLMAHIVPDFQRFGMSEYIANGFDVPLVSPVPPYDSALLPAFMTLLAYALPCLLLGYFSLRSRELESK